MRTLLIIIISLTSAICLYATETDYFGAALSMRTPAIGQMTDYEVSVESSRFGFTGEAVFERENGSDYINYLASYLCPLIDGVEFYSSVHYSEVRHISRMRSLTRYELFHGVKIGLGETLTDYNIHTVAPIMEIYVPLIGENSYLSYSTNLFGSNILDGELFIYYMDYLRSWLNRPGYDGGIRPYILGRFYQDKNIDWQAKIGVRVQL